MHEKKIVFRVPLNSIQSSLANAHISLNGLDLSLLQLLPQLPSSIENMTVKVTIEILEANQVECKDETKPCED